MAASLEDFILAVHRCSFTLTAALEIARGKDLSSRNKNYNYESSAQAKTRLLAGLSYYAPLLEAEIASGNLDGRWPDISAIDLTDEPAPDEPTPLNAVDALSLITKAKDVVIALSFGRDVTFSYTELFIGEYIIDPINVASIAKFSTSGVGAPAGSTQTTSNKLSLMLASNGGLQAVHEAFLGALSKDIKGLTLIANDFGGAKTANLKNQITGSAGGLTRKKLEPLTWLAGVLGSIEDKSILFSFYDRLGKNRDIFTNNNNNGAKRESLASYITSSTPSPVIADELTYVDDVSEIQDFDLSRNPTDLANLLNSIKSKYVDPSSTFLQNRGDRLLHYTHLYVATNIDTLLRKVFGELVKGANANLSQMVQLLQEFVKKDLQIELGVVIALTQNMGIGGTSTISPPTTGGVSSPPPTVNTLPTFAKTAAQQFAQFAVTNGLYSRKNTAGKFQGAVDFGGNVNNFKAAVDTFFADSFLQNFERDTRSFDPLSLVNVAVGGRLVAMNPPSINLTGEIEDKDIVAALKTTYEEIYDYFFTKANALTNPQSITGLKNIIADAAILITLKDGSSEVATLFDLVAISLGNQDKDIPVDFLYYDSVKRENTYAKVLTSTDKKLLEDRYSAYVIASLLASALSARTELKSDQFTSDPYKLELLSVKGLTLENNYAIWKGNRVTSESIVQTKEEPPSYTDEYEISTLLSNGNHVPLW